MKKLTKTFLHSGQRTGLMKAVIRAVCRERNLKGFRTGGNNERFHMRQNTKGTSIGAEHVKKKGRTFRLRYRTGRVNGMRVTSSVRTSAKPNIKSHN